MLVTLGNKFSLYSAELNHVQDVDLRDTLDLELLELVFEMRYIIRLEHSQRGNFILLAMVGYIEQLEDPNVRHTYTGADGSGWAYFMMELNVVEKPSTLQIDFKDLEDK